MATVNSSVPSDVKQLFNETFANRNKSSLLLAYRHREADLSLCSEAV